MSSQQVPQPNIDRYVVIHVATTCDEHGVYVTKDSAEVIELGWMLLDATSLEEVSFNHNGFLSDGCFASAHWRRKRKIDKSFTTDLRPRL